MEFCYDAASALGWCPRGEVMAFDQSAAGHKTSWLAPFVFSACDSVNIGLTALRAWGRFGVEMNSNTSTWV
jgi:hypothetical protein